MLVNRDLGGRKTAVCIEMSHTGTADGGTEIFSTTTPLPVAGPVGYTVREGCTQPSHARRPQRTGLVTLA